MPQNEILENNCYLIRIIIIRDYIISTIAKAQRRTPGRVRNVQCRSDSGQRRRRVSLASLGTLAYLYAVTNAVHPLTGSKRSLGSCAPESSPGSVVPVAQFQLVQRTTAIKEAGAAAVTAEVGDTDETVILIVLAPRHNRGSRRPYWRRLLDRLH